MGLYLRKSFRAGPIRLNLSKSGLGISAGVKGARLGAGPRGNYVHAGRHGLYYRKNLASAAPRSRGATSAAGADSEGCATLLLLVLALGIGWWMLANPVVLVAVIVAAAGFFLIRRGIRQRRRKLLADYKQALDAAFVAAAAPPGKAVLADLGKRQANVPKTSEAMEKIRQIEADVYQAVLDKILDDGFVTKDEATTVAAVEQTLGISPELRLRTRKDIFAAAYAEVIQDREITPDELGRLTNLVNELDIPQAEIQRELDIVREILDTQALCLPFSPIPTEKLAAPIQQSENAFYQCSAQVLSKRKAQQSPSGYEYSVRREGVLILTDKRLFVSGEGTTTVRLSDIEDVDVDMDEGVIEIAKIRSSRPVILKTAAPIYTGRAIDLLVQAEAGGALR